MGVGIMNKQVYDYFEDLDKKKLPRKKHHLIYDGERIINNVTIDKNGNPTRRISKTSSLKFLK